MRLIDADMIWNFCIRRKEMPMKGNEAEILLRDMQEYRELTDRVNTIFGGAMTLKDVVDSIERVSKLQKSNPFNARVLTYDEAAMWDEYRKIGTPEECREAVTKQISRHPVDKTKPDSGYGNYYKNARVIVCPNCNGRLKLKSKGKYCDKCGQKLSWEDA